MGRRKKGTPPSYRLHKQSGLAIVSLPLGRGQYRDVLLGPYDSPESRTRYAEVIKEWEARRVNQSHLVPQPNDDLSINELILAYFKHVQEYYRHPDGTSTSEVRNIKLPLRRLKEAYGTTQARDFDSLALETLRNKMIADGLCRSRINQDIGRLKRCFKWAASKKLVPLEVCQSLMTLDGLRKGRSAAEEAEEVRPVPPEVVEAILEYLLPQTQAMVQLQSLTGMRPGEVCKMRTRDIDTSSDVWIYRPGSDQGPKGQHKTSWRGKDRAIPVGPKAQQVLKPWLREAPNEYLFQPREAREWHNQQRKEKRKTKMTPSQKKRTRKKNPDRQPGEMYKTTAYGHAIAKACEQAGVPRWSPNQLRHTYATRVRKAYGLEAAQVLLGHTRADVTQVYAERDLDRAIEIVSEIG